MDLTQAYDTIGADLIGALSLVIVTFVGLVVVVWDIFRNNDARIPLLTGGALAVAMAWEVTQLWEPSTLIFYETLRSGGFASFVNLVILGSGLASVGLSATYLQRIHRAHGEVYALILFATAGMIALATANNLIMIFVGLEAMSFCLYIMAGLVRDDVGGLESALKYFLLGAFATGFFLYGIALLYGATGTMFLTEMMAGLEASEALVMFWAGVGLLLIGFMFKVSAVPFHMWTPDVYQGAPTTLTGYMSTASKAAAFAALILILFHALPPERWHMVLAVIAVVTMVLGNVLALAQNNVKRMLAYSSIAHGGYILVGLAAGTADGYSGALYYLLIYSLMNLGAFGVMALLEWDGLTGQEQTLDSLAGIWEKRPWLSVAMAIFMFSLIGFPPLGGFFGKVAVFAPAIEAGLTWLAIIGVLASIVSAGYYLRVVYVFIFQAAEEQPEEVRQSTFPVSAGSMVVLTVCAVLLIVIGFVPGVYDLTATFFTDAAMVAGR